MLTEKEKLLVARAKRHGIRYPMIAYEEWKGLKHKPEGFRFSLVCAFLMRETFGGHNVFGHDPTIFVGAGTVTRAKYAEYKRARQRTGKSQGVGSMQLTSPDLQDAADRLGGCWQPRFNMRVGFEFVRELVAAHGLHDGVRAYNGSGPAAERYADAVLASDQVWHHFLVGDKLTALVP